MILPREYARRRRADLVKRKLCLNGALHGKATDGQLCKACRAKRTAYDVPNEVPVVRGGYEPLDVRLEQPMTRILRVIKHFDSIQLAEIFELLGVTFTDRREYDRLYKAVMRAHEIGLVDRAHGNQRWTYWMTSVGVAYLTSITSNRYVETMDEAEL